MSDRAGLGAALHYDRRLTHWTAGWRWTPARKVLPAVESAAEHTVLWWCAAGVLSAMGRRGRHAAATGLSAMLVAQLLGDVAGKRLYERRRPPQELVPGQDTDDRPDSSSFPSGHTAAAAAFASGAALVWPSAGAVCAVPAMAVGVARIHSGAHYPTDVAAGTAIGLVSAQLTKTCARRLFGSALLRKPRGRL